VSGRLISKLRRYLLTSSNNDSTENYISVLRYWPSPLSLSSLLHPTLFQWLSCDPSLALPMPPSFSHSISPGVCSPSLQRTHMHTPREKRPFLLLSEQKIRQHRRAADPCRESRNRASGFSDSAREAASLRFGRDREASGRYLSGFRSPGRRKLVTAADAVAATERISPFNGTGQDGLSNASKSHPRVFERINSVISFQPMLSLGRGANNREISRFVGKTDFMKERSPDNRLVYYTSY